MFFFFKQKTAYELSIIDLSSDVCSSDLYPYFLNPHAHSGVAKAFPCTRHDRCKVCRNNRRVGDSCPSILFAWSYHYPLWLNCVTDHDIAEVLGPNLSLGSDFRSRMKGTVAPTAPFEIGRAMCREGVWTYVSFTV